MTRSTHPITRLSSALTLLLICCSSLLQVPAQAQTCPFDDGNSSLAVEGLILTRYALGVTGAPLVASTGINAVDAPAVEATISCPSCGLNITGNSAMTVADATIISRRLAGFSGAALTDNLALGSGIRNTPAAVQSFLLAGCGATGGINNAATLQTPATFNISGNGLVGGMLGVGTVTPSYKLDVLHAGDDGLRVKSSAGYSTIDIDAFTGDAALRFARAGVNQWNIRNNPTNNSLSIVELGGGGERLRIENSTGNLVIGNNPSVAFSPLQVSIPVAKATAATTRAFSVTTVDATNPFGLDVRLVGAAAIANRGVVIQATDFNLSDTGNILLQPYGGNVGVGVITPTRAKLEIGGSVAATLPGTNGFFGATGTGSTFGATSSPYSLYAASNIAAAGFVAFSDARSKRIGARSNTVSDLATLSAIEITDYTYIDSATKGTGKHKKVIAQQVEKVFPQAVNKTTDVVPDIYKKAAIKDGWVTLATTLKVGDRVRLIGKKSEAVHDVLEAAPGKFRTAFVADDEAVFVYGREVKDFRSVDYEAIAMLNVSATQALNQQLQKQAVVVTAQAAEIKAIKAQLAQITERLAAMPDTSKLVANR